MKQQEQKKQKKEKKESIFQKIRPYLGNKRCFIPMSFLFSGLSSALAILPFYYIWKISREIFSGQSALDASQISYYAFLVVLFSLLAMLLYFISLMISHYAAFEVEIELKKSGFARLMRMPIGFFHFHSSGKIRKIINDGASQTHSFLAHQMPDMAGSIVTPLAVLIIFFSFDWRLGICALIPIILSFLTMSMMMSQEGRTFQEKYTEALDKMSSEAVEYVRAIPVVKTFGQSVHSFTRFYNAIETCRKLVIGYTELWTKPFSAYLVLVEATAMFLIPASIYLIQREGEIGIVISNFILYLLLAPQISLTMMRSMYFTQQKLLATQAIERMEGLFDYDRITYPEEGEKMEGYDLEFRDLVFSYDGQNNAIDGITLSVKSGESLALVGASGSGKTSLARLAARFWDPDSGEVLIGGKNIKTYAKEELMDKIAFVFQNNQLFKTSLRENICFGRPVSDEALEAALTKSRSKEIVEHLEEGLDTVIGKKGTYLSGGEQQRIALARVFLKDAPIILLDEATAFADPENEHLIQAALKDLSKGKTCIMIAHRMTTVKEADKIAVIDGGKVVEYGTHESLLQEGGLYKRMWDEYQTSVAWNIKKGA